MCKKKKVGKLDEGWKEGMSWRECGRVGMEREWGKVGMEREWGKV